MKKQITKQEKLQLTGILTIAQQHEAKVSEALEAGKNLMDIDDWGTHWDDAIFEGYDIDTYLEKEGVEVIDDQHN